MLYQNDKRALARAAEYLANALRVERERAGLLGEASLRWGDASPEPLFTPEEIAALAARLGGELKLEYRFFGRNTGSALGHDLLAEDGAAELLLVMNPDVLLAPRSLTALHAALRLPGTALAEARQLPLEHPKVYDERSLETPWSATACALLRAGAFREVGGFDSDSFFLYGDDVDLSWRLRLAGHILRYCPDAPVCHPKHLDAKARWEATEAERYYAAESALLLSWKWSRPKRLERLLELYAGGTPEQRAAAAAFERRRAAGRLPDRLDAEHRVASFVGWGCAAMRYSY
ncbi:MAG: hypothetical protein IJJ43_03650 [Oscillospiraceae bacterium]|nr:hypothetical protein [Oscillospiraceae bacterium]